MYVQTKHVMVTPSTSMHTCTLLPAFAGSCPQNINTYGNAPPTIVEHTTIEKHAVEIAKLPIKSLFVTYTLTKLPNPKNNPSKAAAALGAS